MDAAHLTLGVSGLTRIQDSIFSSKRGTASCHHRHLRARSAILNRRGTGSKSTMTITAASGSTTTASSTSDQDYDRTKAVKEFDDSKIGVKGLVDSGIDSIPSFFHHPPETLADLKPSVDATVDIPVVDLSADRSLVVDQIKHAANEFGFFQIINHGIPTSVIDHTIESVRAFHEQPTETKSRFYGRDIGTGVAYSSNFDLYQSKAASWRDTLQIRLGPKGPEPAALPEICREEVIQWDREVLWLGEVLMGMLSEGLGLEKNKLKDMTCLEGRVMAGHYYPPCPQPDLTIGLSSHTDPGMLTVVLQDHIGGLQVKYGGGWADVKPRHGAIVINIGDIFQIISNEEYKSVEHRVLANSKHEARTSVSIFFNPSQRENLYGPLPELISTEKPALYRQFTYSDFMRRFFTKELDGKSLINFYRL